MYKDSLRNALKTRENDLKKERLGVKHSPLNQFKQLFIISGFIMSVIFLFILFRKRLQRLIYFRANKITLQNQD
jgi:hypothetical protein